QAAVAWAMCARSPAGALTWAAPGGPPVAPGPPVARAGRGLTPLGLGLAVVMWNSSGWDTPSTVLGEARSPERAFRSATFLALPVLTAAYVLPVGAALASGAMPWSEWTTGALP